MIEEILGGGVLAATRILYVCKWSTRLPQHQIYQSDGFCPIIIKASQCDAFIIIRLPSLI